MKERRRQEKVMLDNERVANPSSPLPLDPESQAILQMKGEALLYGVTNVNESCHPLDLYKQGRGVAHGDILFVDRWDVVVKTPRSTMHRG